MDELSQLEQNEINENKKSKRRFLLLATLFSVIGSGVCFGICLLWQKSTSLMAICEGFYFSGFILFTVGWVVLMYNKNIFSPFTYGTKTTALMFIGKRNSQSYYDYITKIKENPIPKIYYFIPMIASIPNIVTAIILTIILW